MKIETKYDVGNSVFFILTKGTKENRETRIMKGTVERIYGEKNSNKEKIMYEVNMGREFMRDNFLVLPEEELFRTQNEIVKRLFDENFKKLLDEDGS